MSPAQPWLFPATAAAYELRASSTGSFALAAGRAGITKRVGVHEPCGKLCHHLLEQKPIIRINSSSLEAETYCRQPRSRGDLLPVPSSVRRERAHWSAIHLRGAELVVIPQPMVGSLLTCVDEYESAAQSSLRTETAVFA